MQCQMCGKAGMYGNNVSHSNRKTKTRWKANVPQADARYRRQAEEGEDLLPMPPNHVQAAARAEGADAGPGNGNHIASAGVRPA